VTRLGNALYVTDHDRLRKLSLATGKVSTVSKAPASSEPWTPPLGSFLPQLPGLTAGGGHIYLSTFFAIWDHDPQKGTFELLAGDPYGDPDQISVLDGAGTAARFGTIMGLAHDGDGTLYVADGCTVRKVVLSTRVVQTIAGRAAGDQICVAGIKDGAGKSALFYFLMGITHDGDAIYVTDEIGLLSDPSSSYPDGYPYAAGFGRVRRVSSGTWKVTSPAGILPTVPSVLGERDGPASQAVFMLPWGIWADKGAVYVGTRSAVRKMIRSSGHVSTLAGQLLDGPFLMPRCLAMDGEYLYTYLDNVRHQLVRVRLADGFLDVLQNHHPKQFPVEGCLGMVRIGNSLYIATYQPAHSVVAYDLSTRKAKTVATHVSIILDGGKVHEVPEAMTTDGKHLLRLMKVLKATGTGPKIEHEIRRLDPTDSAGKSKTVVTTTKLVEAQRQMAYAQGAVFIANGRTLVRADLASQSISTVAGDPGAAGCQDGVGKNARFTRLAGLAIDGSRILAGDKGCHTIRQIDIATGSVETLAGSPGRTLFKAGNSKEAGLNYPSDLLYDKASHTLFVADPRDNIIIKITTPSDAGGG